MSAPGAIVDTSRDPGQWPAPNLREQWPVGAVFISLNTNNPADTIGYGTWTIVGSGRVLVGVNAADPDFFPVGSTGGSKTLTVVDHTPHTHTVATALSVTTTTVQSGLGATVVDSVSGGTATTSQENHALAHKNGTGASAMPIMNPFLAAYLWERTA